MSSVSCQLLPPTDRVLERLERVDDHAHDGDGHEGDGGDGDQLGEAAAVRVLHHVPQPLLVIGELTRPEVFLSLLASGEIFFKILNIFSNNKSPLNLLEASSGDLHLLHDVLPEAAVLLAAALVHPVLIYHPVLQVLPEEDTN